jgi:hypothetical protein
MGRACRTRGGEEECLRGFGGKEGKRPLIVRHWYSCEDNIKMGVIEMGWGVMDWIYLARDRYQWKAPQNVWKFLSN